MFVFVRATTCSWLQEPLFAVALLLLLLFPIRNQSRTVYHAIAVDLVRLFLSLLFTTTTKHTGEKEK